MMKRKNVFTERKRQRELDEYTGLRLPRSVDFNALPPAIVDGVFLAKAGDKVAFDYPIELGQKVVCIGTVFDGPGKETGAVYLWNETMGNRTYSFKLPEALTWVCDIRLLEGTAAETGQGRRRRRRKDIIDDASHVDVSPPSEEASSSIDDAVLDAVDGQEADQLP